MNANKSAEYRRSEAGKRAIDKYNRSNKGRTARRAAQKAYRERCLSAVYLARVTLDNGSSLLKVGQSNIMEERKVGLPASAKNKHGLSVKSVEIVRYIQYGKGDTAGRTKREKEILATASPIIGKEYFHADLEQHFVQIFDGE